MKKYKCLTHNTILKTNEDEEGSNERNININFEDLGCLLPSLEKPKECQINKCNIVEVEDNG